LLVPLLGFDEAGYRLGYGGGYYDRTLATMNPTPLTVGVGYEFARLETIYPQPHDIPLDAIVTEAGCAWLGSRDVQPRGTTVAPPMDKNLPLAENLEGAAYASPACLLHEVDPEYLGYLSAAEMIALLNQLLEGERAGARGVTEIVRNGVGVSDHFVLLDIAKDEGHFCVMLARHIFRLGGTPSPRTGAFYAQLMALNVLRERIDFLNRGQAWVVRKLQEVLPRIGDNALHSDLKNMLDVHDRNIERCADLG
jgi:hypothetical protein